MFECDFSPIMSLAKQKSFFVNGFPTISGKFISFIALFKLECKAEIHQAPLLTQFSLLAWYYNTNLPVQEKYFLHESHSSFLDSLYKDVEITIFCWSTCFNLGMDFNNMVLKWASDIMEFYDI